MSESATEVLCRMLDELGVEWKDGDAAYEIEWSTPDGRYCSAMYWKPTFSVLISHCTPEQAIAATLGDGEYELKMDELLCRLTNGKWSKSRSYSVDFMVGCVDEAYEDAMLDGKLTAEQVHDAIFNGSVYASYDGAQYYASGINMQAIADELNATTGGMEDDGLPSVEWGRIVTGLIAAHYDNDEERFRERAVKTAKMYDERGKYEVAEYITARYCPSTAFVPM